MKIKEALAEIKRRNRREAYPMKYRKKIIT
jgi:hypothetical protein